MAEIKKSDGQNEPVSIETAKVIQGISLVFCGALTMLEALHPHVSLAPSAILDLVTGNVEGLKEAATEKRASAAQKKTNLMNPKPPRVGQWMPLLFLLMLPLMRTAVLPVM